MGSRASATPPLRSISGLGWRGGLRGVALAAAVGLTAAWAFLDLLFALTHAPGCSRSAAVVDVLRVGAWFAFLLLLIERRGDGAGTARPAPRTTWLVPVAAALVVLGVLAQVAVALGLTAFGDPGRLALFDGLALTVFGLVLVEQLFRNLPEDARWSIKPLCLGLAGGVHLRSLSLRRCAAVQPRRRRRVERARLRPRARDSAGGHVGGAQSRLDASRSRCRGASYSTRPRCWCRASTCCSWRQRATTSAISAGRWGRALQVALLFAGVARARRRWRSRGRFARSCGSSSASISSATATTIATSGCASRRRCRRAAGRPSSGRTSSRGSPTCWKARPEASGCGMRRAVISRRPRAGTCRPMRRRSPPTVRSRGSSARRAGS